MSEEQHKPAQDDTPLSMVKSNPVSFGVGFVTVAGIFTLAFNTATGSSDREGAQNHLEEKGYTVISYEGKPGFFMQTRDAKYEDAFKVVTPDNDTTDVIVARNNKTTLIVPKK